MFPLHGLNSTLQRILRKLEALHTKDIGPISIHSMAHSPDPTPGALGLLRHEACAAEAWGTAGSGNGGHVTDVTVWWLGRDVITASVLIVRYVILKIKNKRGWAPPSGHGTKKKKKRDTDLQVHDCLTHMKSKDSVCQEKDGSWWSCQHWYVYVNLNKKWDVFSMMGHDLWRVNTQLKCLHGKSQWIMYTCLEPEISLLSFLKTDVYSYSSLAYLYFLDFISNI